VPKIYPRLDLAKLTAFPEELRKLQQWVCWVLKHDPGRPKPAKLLIDPKPTPHRAGRDASHSDQRTWASFKEASAFFEAHTLLRYQGKEVPVCGLGFVFSSTDPYTGIDIDDCRDPSTGTLLPEAEAMLSSLRSYAELSPSGSGVYIIVNATLPSGGGRRRHRIEMYSHSRYFTVTGDHLATTPLAVEPRQAELQSIYDVIFGTDPPPPEPERQPDDPKLARVRTLSDDELLAKATAAANGQKFRDLWDGNGVADHSQADAALCALLAYWTRADRERVDRLFRRSALFRPKWDQRRGRDSYGQRTVDFACRGCVSMYDPDMEATVWHTFNDMANRELFMQLHGSDEFIWNNERETWLSWNCQRWQQDHGNGVIFAAEDVSKELLRRTLAHPNPDPKVQAKLLKWCTTSGDRARLQSIERLARHPMGVPSKLFDTDPWLLCCKNGVLDLRTGDLRDGQRADYITRCLDYSYLPHAKCPTFDGFLDDIMQGDQDMIEYLWRVIGYSLTGDTTERAFFFLHGEGRNGKSTFIETLMALVGSGMEGYGQKARFSTFLKKAVTNNINSDVAHLAGARVVVASEADESQPLDVATVKELTGGDTARARHLYQGEFEFKPQFKLFLVTNKIPPIRETTYAIWDRLHYIPFEWRIPEAQVDRKLPLKLYGELPGILAHAVRSCLFWQQENLMPPEKVLKAGKALYAENDLCGQYMLERCAREDNNKVRHSELYADFHEWCKAQGMHRPLSSKWLASELRIKGFTSERLTDNVMFWAGLRILNPRQGSLGTGGG